MTNLKSFPVTIQKDVPLAPLTTFKIGGPAKFLAQVNNQEELIKTIIAARQEGWPIFILGGGSNVLIADTGFDGLVILNQANQVEIKGNKIIAQSGANLASLVALAKQNQLSGLECCIGVPGSLGGAIRGNAGAGKDFWIDQVVEEVGVLDVNNQVVTFSGQECLFEYRGSRFSDSQDVILQATLSLQPETITTIKNKEANFLSARQKQPAGKSAGSIFKNPPHGSAGQLIDQAGLKGEKRGDAQISPDHANFIINNNQAKAKDVLELIKKAKQTVKKQFAINLEPEIKLINFTKEEIKDII